MKCLVFFSYFSIFLFLFPFVYGGMHNNICQSYGTCSIEFLFSLLFQFHFLASHQFSVFKLWRRPKSCRSFSFCWKVWREFSFVGNLSFPRNFPISFFFLFLNFNFATFFFFPTNFHARIVGVQKVSASSSRCCATVKIARLFLLSNSLTHTWKCERKKTFSFSFCREDCIWKMQMKTLGWKMLPKVLIGISFHASSSFLYYHPLIWNSKLEKNFFFSYSANSLFVCSFPRNSREEKKENFYSFVLAVCRKKKRKIFKPLSPNGFSLLDIIAYLSQFETSFF